MRFWSGEGSFRHVVIWNASTTSAPSLPTYHVGKVLQIINASPYSLPTQMGFVPFCVIFGSSIEGVIHGRHLTRISTRTHTRRQRNPISIINGLAWKGELFIAQFVLTENERGKTDWLTCAVECRPGAHYSCSGLIPRTDPLRGQYLATRQRFLRC